MLGWLRFLLPFGVCCSRVLRCNTCGGSARHPHSSPPLHSLYNTKQVAPRLLGARPPPGWTIFAPSSSAGPTVVPTGSQLPWQQQPSQWRMAHLTFSSALVACRQSSQACMASTWHIAGQSEQSSHVTSSCDEGCLSHCPLLASLWLLSFILPERQARSETHLLA